MTEIAGQNPESEIANLTAIVMQAVDAADDVSIKSVLEKLHPSEVALLLSSLPLKERLHVWGLLNALCKGEALPHLAEDIRVGLLKETATAELVSATSHLDLDDLTDLMQDLPSKLSQTIIQSMERQNRQQLETTMAYSEDTAGGLMDLDAISIRQDMNVGVVLNYLRKLGKLPPATDKLMIVNRDNKFLGSLHISRILTSDNATPIRNLINQEAIAIPVNMPDTEVASIFKDRDLLSAPVVDENDKLLGRITVDDVVDVILEDAEEALMARDGLDDELDIFSPVKQSAWRRTPWLAIHLVTSFIAIYVVSMFEKSIAQIVALAILMPLNASMGGVTGSQTMTLVIRGIALNRINNSNFMWLIGREAAVGLVNGVFWALVVAVITFFWFGSANLGMVIAAAMIINLFIATVAGAVIPLIQKRLGIDPALAGHVVLTAVTDVIGFLSFLGLATIILL